MMSGSHLLCHYLSELGTKIVIRLKCEPCRVLSRGLSRWVLYCAENAQSLPSCYRQSNPKTFLPTVSCIFLALKPYTIAEKMKGRVCQFFFHFFFQKSSLVVHYLFFHLIADNVKFESGIVEIIGFVNQEVYYLRHKFSHRIEKFEKRKGHGGRNKTSINRARIRNHGRD